MDQLIRNQMKAEIKQLPELLEACVENYINSFDWYFYFREVAFLDMIIISLNFVIRAVSGIFIINEEISAWIILSTFFLLTSVTITLSASTGIGIIIGEPTGLSLKFN